MQTKKCSGASLKNFVCEYALRNYTFEGEQEDYFIGRLIHTHMRGKRVLDLGCGPVVPILSIFYPDAEEVVAVDRLQANLDFIQKNADKLEGSMRRALTYKKRYLSRKKTNPKIKLVRGDITQRLDLGRFDAVMNLGCFGALDTQKQFQDAVNHAYHYLKKDGTLLMVNWVGEVKRPYHFNGKVYEPDVYAPCMEGAGFKIKEIHITGKNLSGGTRKMGYKKIIWAVAKK